ncbi:ABC transporter substrate-binding protein [Thiohalorhabdus methylotrophus]|uniref:ABC transporter substrate-binding protein n=1 Tax=Thiohalorhabdus methylotrophus TaxID=3242694 RepID=A0ABV4TW93_9GAMM
MTKPTDTDDHGYLFDHEMGRRDFMLDSLAAGGLLASGLSLPARMARAAVPDDEVVRIGYLPITDATALLVAYAKGFFKQEGLKAEAPTLIRGWSPLVEGFSASKFNLVHLLKPIPVWMRYNNNFPVKITAWAHINGSGLVVGRHMDAQRFADLGGSQIAVPYWYSQHNIILQMGLREAGLKPVLKDMNAELAPDEVNLSIMPPPDMAPALASRKIDGYIVAEPFNAAGELLAGAKMLRFTGDIWRNHPCCVVCMNENALETKPEWSQKVTNAVVKAQIYAQQNKAEVAHLLSKDGEGYLPMPANVVKRAMTSYADADYAEPDAIHHPEWDNGRIDFQPYPFPSATRFIVEAMTKTKVGGDTTFLNDLDPDFVANDLVEYRYVERAMKQIRGWENAPGIDMESPFKREEVISL